MRGGGPSGFSVRGGGGLVPGGDPAGKGEGGGGVACEDQGLEGIEPLKIRG